MKKGDIYEGIIEKVELPNKGITVIDGGRVVTKDIVPSRKIQYVVTKRGRGRSKAGTLEILERSPLGPPDNECPYLDLCGGCTYQSLPYEGRLRIKEGQIRSLLDSVVEPEAYGFQGIKASLAVRGYRSKMEFSFRDKVKDGPPALRMHERGSSYDIMTMPECQIAHPDFCRILVATKGYFGEPGTASYRKLQYRDYLCHLLVRRAVRTGETLVNLVTNIQQEYLGGRDEETVFSEWKERLLSLPADGGFAGTSHTENDSLADVVQNDAARILYGQDYFYEKLLELCFGISPFSFFQISSLGVEILYGTVRNLVDETRDEVVFDLYSGTGTIAQILVSVVKKVVGAEIVEEAVEAAGLNAGLNGLDNYEFTVGDVLKVTDGLKDRPDLIVVNPPRDEIHPEALGKIIDFRVEQMMYISCKPTSLVRDLMMLRERGYRAEKVCRMDTFPGTGNIEAVIMMWNCGSKGKHRG